MINRYSVFTTVRLPTRFPTVATVIQRCYVCSLVKHCSCSGAEYPDREKIGKDGENKAATIVLLSSYWSFPFQSMQGPRGLVHTLGPRRNGGTCVLMSVDRGD